MINRFQEIKDDSSYDYESIGDDKVKIREIKYSIMEDMGKEIRNSNNILEDVRKNQRQMRDIMGKYNGEATPKGEK